MADKKYPEAVARSYARRVRRGEAVLAQVPEEMRERVRELVKCGERR